MFTKVFSKAPLSLLLMIKNTRQKWDNKIGRFVPVLVEKKWSMSDHDEELSAPLIPKDFIPDGFLQTWDVPTNRYILRGDRTSIPNGYECNLCYLPGGILALYQSGVINPHMSEENTVVEESTVEPVEEAVEANSDPVEAVVEDIPEDAVPSPEVQAVEAAEMLADEKESESA